MSTALPVKVKFWTDVAPFILGNKPNTVPLSLMSIELDVLMLRSGLEKVIGKFSGSSADRVHAARAEVFLMNPEPMVPAGGDVKKGTSFTSTAFDNVSDKLLALVTLIPNGERFELSNND